MLLLDGCVCCVSSKHVQLVRHGYCVGGKLEITKVWLSKDIDHFSWEWKVRPRFSGQI